MSLFKHKSEKGEVPALPELPKLPELPPIGEEEGQIHQLPTFPRNSLGEKFSQDTIKEAVTGEKEEGGRIADDFKPLDEKRMMQEPLQKDEEYSGSLFKGPPRREIGENENFDDFFKEEEQKEPPIKRKAQRERGPIFVRLDKFEESQKIFEETKKELSEISKLLNETKNIKQKEEETLQNWERELESVRTQIDKVDRNLFSKL
ncbi:hypothetical protein B6U91_00110 [Candidatus Pacearchaeota archaeon ex4484_71]|nr:MAG: hypothetical protein B6U91_00110 [Candidatus Pacearchaeota archaeon ex4484_71]